MNWLTQAAYQWYIIMSQASAAVSEPLQRVMDSQNIPGLSALLLGLLGGLAPCQVTANAGAIAYVTQTGQERKPLWGTVGAFIGGKAAVYLVFGFLTAILGLTIPIPFLALMRKLNGPLMVLIALYLMGLIRWRGDIGARVTAWVQARMPRRGPPAFWLGVAFSLGFCPTMALIFFGALVPLMLQSPAGLSLAAIFAVGTAVPVMLWALTLTAGQGVAGRWVRRVRNLDRYIRWGAAVVFLLVGLNDILLYWFA